jgi:hypothetical protein
MEEAAEQLSLNYMSLESSEEEEKLFIASVET